MPTAEEITAEQQRLYESASLRDDLNDAEAGVLLKWGEGQVAQMAQRFPDEFEQKCRFLRQLIKNINRFVGQREFNELDGQKEYMADVVKYLAPLGYIATEEALFAALPADKTDMADNLQALLNTLTPPAVSSDTATPPTTFRPDSDPTEIIPDIRDLPQNGDG